MMTKVSGVHITMSANFCGFDPIGPFCIRPAFGQKNHDLQKQVFQDEPRDPKKPS